MRDISGSSRGIDVGPACSTVLPSLPRRGTLPRCAQAIGAGSSKLASPVDATSGTGVALPSAEGIVSGTRGTNGGPLSAFDASAGTCSDIGTAATDVDAVHGADGSAAKPTAGGAYADVGPASTAAGGVSPPLRGVHEAGDAPGAGAGRWRRLFRLPAPVSTFRSTPPAVQCRWQACTVRTCLAARGQETKV